MKSIYEMNGIERSAALLVALGPDIAADILKQMDEDEIERLSGEIARIERLDPTEREDLIGEFIIRLRRESSNLKAGEGKARELLTDAFGEDRAEEVLRRFSGKDVDREFEYLQEIEPPVLSEILKGEGPQTVAVCMSFLPGNASAAILKSLPLETQKEVALRLAKMQSVTPEAAVSVARVIRKKYREYKKADNGILAGGIDSLIGILQHMNAEDERRFMANLDTSMPDMSEKIREKVFTFENIARLSNRDIRILIDEVNDDLTIAKALKGSGDEIRFRFLRNMSQNRATDIINEMKAMGPVHLNEVDFYRHRILATARELHDNGAITFQKRGADDVWVT